jgi:AcrR family transcriptional regulator
LRRKDSEPDRSNPKVRQLLAAAQTLFLEQGYDAVTMDMVVDLAHVSKATAYVHFASKDVLFATVMIDLTGLSGDQIWVPTTEFDDIAVELERVARNFMNCFLTRQAILFRRTLVSAVVRFPSIGHAVFDSGPKIIIDRTAMFMAAAGDAGCLKISDPELAATQFLSLVRGFVDIKGMLSKDMPSTEEIEADIRSAVAVFLSHYRA